jgi:hypothetical protein
MVPIQLPRRTQDCFQRLVDYRLIQTSLDRRSMPSGHSADAMGSRGHRGGVITARQLGNAPEIPEGSTLPDRREIIMIMSEYEERFRSPTPSLHQIFAEARGPNRGRWRSRRLWAAVALVGVMTLTSRAALQHTTHSNGSQVWKSGIQACDFIQWYSGGDK